MTPSKASNVLPFLLAAVIGVVAIAPYLEFNGQLILEPDVQWPAVRLYYDAIRTWSLAPLSVPGGNAYFEGHCVVYAVAIHIYEFVRGLFAPDATPVSANFTEVALVVIRCVNAVARVLATVVFFATVRGLSGRTWAAAILTFLLACSPQIFAMDLERIDHFMILPLVVILHISVAIARGTAGWRHGAVLGAAIGVLSATKMSGLLFGGFPAIAMIVALVNGRKDTGVWKRQGIIIVAAVVAGLPLLALLMIRYVLYWPYFLTIVETGYLDQMTWTAVFNYTPRLYYNIDLFAPNGWFFLTLTGICAILVAADAVMRRAPVSIWVTASLALYSILGIIAFKYDRGGYHLVPLYLYVLALSIPIAERFAARLPLSRRKIAMAAVAASLLIPAGVAAAAFTRSADIALKRPESIARSRHAARDWMIAHFTPGMRICMPNSSQWASPKLHGLGFHVTTRLFDFPYLKSEDMERHVAPSVAQVRAGCDAVVFNDFHKRLYVEDMRIQGHAERAAEWDNLYQALAAHFPPVTFTANTPAFYVTSVEVMDLRNAPADAALEVVGPLSRNVARSGVIEGETIRFDTTSLRIVPGRYAGFIDTAQRDEHGNLLVQGWTMDASRQAPAVGVLFVVGSQVVDYDATGTERRPDVVKAFANPALAVTGFASCPAIDAQIGDIVRVFAVGSDGTAGELGPSGGLAVTASPHASLLSCASNEG